MMTIRITNTIVPSQDIEKALKRKNFQNWLENKGILEWHYNYNYDILCIWVVDDFNVSLLDDIGTWEVVESD